MKKFSDGSCSCATPLSHYTQSSSVIEHNVRELVHVRDDDHA